MYDTVLPSLPLVARPRQGTWTSAIRIRHIIPQCNGAGPPTRNIGFYVSDPGDCAASTLFSASEGYEYHRENGCRSGYNVAVVNVTANKVIPLVISYVRT